MISQLIPKPFMVSAGVGGSLLNSLQVGEVWMGMPGLQPGKAIVSFFCTVCQSLQLSASQVHQGTFHMYLFLNKLETPWSYC